MQLKRAIAAGALGALMAGSTLAFAASLSDYPAPFATAAGADALIVVGATAATSDVVGAIDVAARLGGASVSKETVTCPGAAGGISVSGEGKTLDTATTHVFLQDNLGKTGLRTTLTKSDLPTLLASGSMTDADGTHKYDQFIDMTPGTTNANNTNLQFDKPGSSSAADPTYNFGRITPSPSATEFLYKTRLSFDVPLNGTNIVGKSLTIFGNDYTVSADTSANLSAASAKLVLFGGANVQTLHGGASTTVTLGGQTYTVTLLGVQSDGKAVIQVGSTTETVAKSATSTNFGDLKVFVKESASLSTTDQTQNIATLLIGADKIVLQDGSKVKKGTNEDSVDGTLVDLVPSGEKLSQMTIYFGGSSSTNDFISAGASTYENPVFKTFGVNFAGMTPSVGGSTDDKLELRNSGENDLQLTFTDANSNKATINWAHKTTSGATQLFAADSSGIGNPIILAEGQTVARDQYVSLDAGGFPHIFKVTNVNLDGSSSAAIELYDLFVGTTTKITTGTDNQESAVIDGQTYNFVNVSSTTFNVTWGTGASLTSLGTYTTVWPALKGKNGEWVALTQNATTVAGVNTSYQLPTGAVTVTITGNTTSFAAANREDGTSSSVTTGTNTLNLTLGSGYANVYVGRTATGGVWYNLTSTAANQLKFSVEGSGNATTITQPAVLLYEEKDDAGNQAAVVLAATTGVSGSNNLVGIAAPDFTQTANSGSQAWGSNSNKASTADLWGTVAVRDTSSSAQPIVDLWYPDTQRYASVHVLKSGATISTAAATAGQTVEKQTVVAVKSTIAKLDTEVTDADKTGKNLILVGGPAVNTLVKTLADAGKAKNRDYYVTQGEGSALLQLVNDAFTSGKAALVVAGHSAADTRAAASILQKYDQYAAQLTGSGVAIKNGAITGALA